MKAIKFSDYILDNVHGYISLTSLEKELESLPAFRRLRGVKQLGATNWVFPGAEHTRYSHSLGVMHIADIMAQKLGFTQKERQLARVTGMLHDVGHYPLSHVGERAYRRFFNGDKVKKSDDISLFYTKRLLADEKQPSFITHTLMNKSLDTFHHESISERVIRSSGAIKEALSENDISVDDVCSIITGDIKDERLIKFVQILHSEMDADRIDYLLRDASSSGAGNGAAEISALIRRMEIVKHPYYGVDIMGVNSKGVVPADQFLINRYFTFAQVFRHKYVTIINRMCEDVMYWLLKNGDFPQRETLFSWIDSVDSNDGFFNFTDSFFFSEVNGFSEKHPLAPPSVKCKADMLSKYAAPRDKRNIIISGASNLSIIEGLDERGALESADGYAVIEETFLTKHAAKDEFIAAYEMNDVGLDIDECLKRRLIDGVAVIRDKNDVALLYDERSSVVKDLRRHRTVFFRIYEME
ncbi:MAG: HD domain-containing protein [Clostridiales bacterium]|nr:HD domain-containing protein [Clostridiales bacterium]